MLKRDAGLTLIEIVIAFVILSVLALLTTRTLTTATATLSKTSEQSLKAQEAMRWVRLVRYDIQGSTDLYDYGSAYPTTQTYMCSKSRTLADPISAWNAIGSLDAPQPTGVRALFTVVVKDVSYARSNSDAPAFLTPTYSWIGYEVRRASVIDTVTTPPYELWRVVCADSGTNNNDASTPQATPLSEERVLDLGKTIDDTVSGLSVVACPVKSGSGLTFCPDAGLSDASASTAQIPWYSLSLPFSKTQGQLLNRDAATLLNAVSRMVGK